MTAFIYTRKSLFYGRAADVSRPYILYYTTNRNIILLSTSVIVCPRYEVVIARGRLPVLHASKYFAKRIILYNVWKSSERIWFCRIIIEYGEKKKTQNKPARWKSVNAPARASEYCYYNNMYCIPYAPGSRRVPICLSRPAAVRTLFIIIIIIYRQGIFHLGIFRFVFSLLLLLLFVSFCFCSLYIAKTCRGRCVLLYNLCIQYACA